MKCKLIILFFLLLFLSCSQHFYFKNKIGYTGQERKAKIQSLTHKVLTINDSALFTGKFVVQSLGNPIPNLIFYLTSKTDTFQLKANNFGFFSFYSQKNETFKMFIKYVGYEPSIVDSIPLTKGNETSMIIELKEKIILD
jgi:hypothetical protein